MPYDDAETAYVKFDIQMFQSALIGKMTNLMCRLSHITSIAFEAVPLQNNLKIFRHRTDTMKRLHIKNHYKKNRSYAKTIEKLK